MTKKRDLTKPLSKSKFDSDDWKKQAKKGIKKAVNYIGVKNIKKAVNYIQKGTPIPKSGNKYIDKFTKGYNVKGFGRSTLKVVDRKTGKKNRLRTGMAKVGLAGYKYYKSITGN